MVYKSFPIVTKPVQKPHLLCAPRTQRIPPDPWVTMKEPLLNRTTVREHVPLFRALVAT